MNKQIKIRKNKLAVSIALGLLLSINGTALAAPASNALPTNGVSGTTTIGDVTYTDANIAAAVVKDGKTIMDITQHAKVNTGYINWGTFNVGTDAVVNFKQQSSAQTMVNTVANSGGLSEIYGNINASGNVVLINPNGVLFDGATVNVGGLAVYAASSMKADEFNKDLTQGNITIKNSKITAGIATAADLAVKKFGIKDYAVGITSNANRIRLVADGDVIMQGANTVLTAMDTTVATGTHIEGEEEFEMEGNASVAGPQVNIRADANSDDYGTVTITHGDDSPNIITKEVHILYNPELVGTYTTPNENGTAVTTQYNKKNYKDGEINFNEVMDGTTAVTSTKVTTDATGLYEKADTVETTATGIATADARMLVNNIAQLQDIDDIVYGKLSGKYALGKNIDATGDTASYILGETVLFKGDSAGNVSATSTVDGGVYTNTGSNITKTVDSYSISYTAADSKASAIVGSDKYAYACEKYFKNDVEVSNTSGWPTGLATYLTTAQGEFGAVATTEFVKLGTAINTINSANWGDTAVEDTTKRQGFNPIGDSTNPFTGSFDGFGGDGTHSISNLTINLGGTDGTDGQDNVGLFGVVSGGSLIRTNLNNAQIVGQNNVGGLAGQLINGSSISWSHNSGDKGIEATVEAPGEGYVKVSGTGVRTNIGGLVGVSDASTISNSSNTATIIGRTADDEVNVSMVGGIAGSLVNGSKATNIANAGNVFGEQDTGGLIGYGDSSQIGVNNTVDNLTAASFNRGQVDGVDNTGGIAGHIEDTKLHGVYNTNEDAALGANSQYYVHYDAANKVLVIDKQGGSAGTKLANENFTSSSALSEYGQVTGVSNTGGLVGRMEDSSADNTKSEIDTAYNAGNVTGKGNSAMNTGGLVGKMTGGKITNAYNGDNNTVIREALNTVPDAVKVDTVVTVGDQTYTFKYHEADAAYYSFYTVNTDGSRNYYYFKSVGDTTTKGAGGVFVTADGKYVGTLDNPMPAEAGRYYMNRIGYKDANVSGKDFTGGIVGYMSGGSVDTTYNVGSVAGTAASTGALIGSQGKATLSNSFWVSGTDASTGKAYSKVDKGVGYKSGDATTNKVYEYTLGDARDRTTLHTNFGDSFVGQIVNTESGTGYSIYSNGGTTYYFDNTETIYTKSGTTYTAKYTKDSKTVGHIGEYKDANGYYYKYTVDPDNKDNFILTPVVEGEGKKTTFAGQLVATNQSSTWLAYEEQTAPLLKYFMNTSNIDRVFAYDGSSHNLKTDDVADIYGRADFEVGSGAGNKVQSDGYANSTKYEGSSEYYYDNSTIWSPQHGYKMNPKASVIITPIDLKITLTGDKTYGDINNLKGYYISVPYTNADGDTAYYFYTVDKDTTTDLGWKYTLLQGDALTTFFGDYAQNASGLQQKANANAKYVVTMDGILASEANTIDVAVSGVVSALSGGNKGDDFNGSIWGTNHDAKDDQKLSAGGYSFDADKGKDILTGVTAQNNDYTITYTGNLNIEKADLYYTYDGVRDYGAANSTGTHTYTLVGIDDNSETQSITGYLKSFDETKVTLSGKVVTLAGGDNTYTLTGTVAANNNNITANGTQAITQNKSNDAYYQVMVDSTGTPIGYVLKTFGNGTLTLKSDDANINKNYNLVFKTGGDYTDFRSTTSGSQQVNKNTAVTVANSTQEIDPVSLTVSVDGTRYYGNNMVKNAYSTTAASTVNNNTWKVTLTGLVGGDTASGTSATILNETKIKTLLDGVEKTYASASDNFISNHTNKGDGYNIKSGTLTGSNIDLGTKTAANNHYDILAANNYNYKVTNTANTLNIKARPVTVTTTGTKIYGQANSDIVVTAPTTNTPGANTGLVTWDTSKFNSVAYLAAVTESGDTKQWDAGKHGTKGTAHKTGALVYSDTTKNTINTDLGDNYAITYADLLTIAQKPINSVTVTVTGNRVYGELMNTTNWTAGTTSKGAVDTTAGSWYIAVTGTGIETWDETKIADKSAFNTTNVSTMLKGVEDTNNGTSKISYNTNKGTYNLVTGGTTYTGSIINLVGNTTLLKNYVIEQNVSNQLVIKPRPITVTVNGKRIYGDTMTAAVTTTTAIPTKDDLTTGEFNVTVANWSTNADALSSAIISGGVSGLVGAAEGDYVESGTKISNHTNKGTYKLDGTATGYASSNITDAVLANVIDTKGGNYEITNNTSGHSLVIDPKALTVDISGERIYGDANSTTHYIGGVTSGYEIKDVNSSITTWDQAGLAGLATFGVKNDTVKATDASTTGYTDKLSIYNQTGMETTYGNYTLSYTSKYVIDPSALIVKVIGTKIYGTATETNGNSSQYTLITPTGGTDFKNNDDWNLSLLTVTNGVGLKDNVGTYYKITGLTSSEESTTFNKNNYTITVDEANSTFDVTKRDLVLTTTGTNRTYGNNNSGVTYTIADTTPANTTQGLTTWDYADTLGKTTVYDDWKGTVNNSTTDHTNAGTYGTADGGTDEVLTLGKDIVKATQINNNTATMGDNYNITYKDSFEIDKRKVELTTNGSKTYGNDDPANNTYVITDTTTDKVSGGLTSWDKATTLGTATTYEKWQNSVSNSTDKYTNAKDAAYTGVLTLGDAIVKATEINPEGGTPTATMDTNYEITYKDSFNVGKRKLELTTTGNKTYGNDDPAKNTYVITDTTTDKVSGGLTSWDKATTLGTATTYEKWQNSVSNSTDKYTNAKDAAYTGVLTLGDAVVKATEINPDGGTPAATMGTNYEITYKDSFEVGKRDLVLTSTGSKTYGDADPAYTAYAITGNTKTATAGLTDWDQASTLGDTDGVYKAWRTKVSQNNTTDEKTDAGYYGTVHAGDKVLTLDDNAVKTTRINNNTATMGDNYNITYEDGFTIDKRTLKVTATGSKIYGEATINGVNTGNAYTIESTGLQNGDKFDTTKVEVTNTVAAKDNVGTYSQGETERYIDTVTNFVNDTTGTHTFKTDNYTIEFDADKSSYEVKARPMVINLSGERIYGDANNTTGAGYTVTASQASGSGSTATGILADEQAGFNTYWQSGAGSTAVIDNTATPQTSVKRDVGGNVVAYVNNKTTHDTGAKVTVNNTEDVANAFSNYDITYTSDYTINPRAITVSQTGTKEYGTGNEHSSYNPIELANVANGQEEAIRAAAHTSDTSNRTTNVGDYKNSDGKDNGMLTVNLSGIDDILSNYDVTYDTTMTITKADFTYTSDHTEYWQGTPIPAQTGKVTNKYGEDVSDLVGTITWDTTADTYVPDIYPILGHGSNDGGLNYNALQSTDPDNQHALRIKPRPNDMQVNAINAYGIMRRPLLDIRYLESTTPTGINRWEDAEELAKPSAKLYDKNKKLIYSL